MSLKFNLALINGGGGYIQPQPQPVPIYEYEQIPVPESITDITQLQYYMNQIYSIINDLQVRYSAESDPLVKQNLYNLLQYYNELLVRYKNRYDQLVQQQYQQYYQQQQQQYYSPETYQQYLQQYYQQYYQYLQQQQQQQQQTTPTVTYNRVTYQLVVNKRIEVVASVFTMWKAIVEAELKWDTTPITNKGGRIVGCKLVFDIEIPSQTTLITEYGYKVIFNNNTVYEKPSTTNRREHVEVDVPVTGGLNQGRIEFNVGVGGFFGGVPLGIVGASMTFAVINPTLVVVADIPSNVDLNQLDNELKDANQRLVSVTPTPTPTPTPTTDIFQFIIQLLNYLPIIFIILLIIEIIKAIR